MVEILLWVFGGVFSILFWLLRNKDTNQENKIKDLDIKFNTIAKELTDHRIKIAEDHYKKEELDSRFSQLQAAFKAGFEDLGRKFDKLSDRLTDYIERK